MREILLEEGRRVPLQQELGAHLGGTPGADHEQGQLVPVWREGLDDWIQIQLCGGGLSKQRLFVHFLALGCFVSVLQVEENTLLYKHCNGEFKPIIVRPVGPSVVLTACVEKPEITLTRLSGATMLKKVYPEHDPPIWAQARVL